MNLSGLVAHTILITGLVVLQTTIFKHGLIAGVTPDVAFVFLLLSSHHHGSFRGEIEGFISGLVQDFLSLTPMGFHAFIRTIISFLYGLFRGKLFIDPILMPMLLAAIGTFAKAIFSFIILSIFSPEHAGTVFSKTLGITIGLNTLISPFLYGLLRLTGILKPSREESRL